MGRAPVVRSGYVVVLSRVHLRDRGERHADQPNGIEPQAL